MQGAYFNLSEGEKILREIKPLPSLRNYYFVVTLFLPVLPLFIIIYFGGFLFEITRIYVLSALFLLAGFLWMLASGAYSQEQYWITNKRLIYKRGMLGYRITSVPYERISDVMISKTFWENMFGFSSLHVQSLAGQTTMSLSGSGLGAEGSLNAISNPEELQEIIFKLIKEKRKEEHLSF